MEDGDVMSNPFEVCFMNFPYYSELDYELVLVISLIIMFK